MKSKILPIQLAVLLISFYSLHAQTLSPNVTPTQGGYSSSSSVSLSWTMGQTYNPTLTGGSTELSEGFEQPEVDIITGTITGSPFCSGASITIPFTSPGFVDGANVFTAQLSDASGSFASPFTLGMVTSISASGSITGTLPTVTSVGTGYLVRVVSSTPVYNGKVSATTITINPLPTAIISGTTTVCANGTSPLVMFTGSNGTAPYTFTYNINGGSSQTVTTTSGNSVTVSAPTSASGTFVYNLVSVQDASASACSQTQTGTATITVDQLPSVIISGGTTTICNGNAAGTFTAAASGGSGSGYTYQWYNSSGSISLATNITYSPGNLTASNSYYCIATNTACSQSATSNTISITVDAVVGASISGGTTTICNGADPGVLTATGSGGSGSGYTYQWYDASSAQNGATNSTFDPGALTSSDSYYCIITNTACSQSATSNNIAISVYNVLSASISGGTTSICTGSSPGTFTATGNGGSGSYTYQWYDNSGSISNATNNTYSAPSLTSNDSYYCIVTDAGGCGTANTGSTAVTVYPPVSNYGTITASAGTAQSLCANVHPAGTFTVTGAAGGSGSFNYQWYYQAGLVSAPAPTDPIPGSWTACDGSNGTGYNTATFAPSGTPANISYACVVTPASAPSCVGNATWASGVLQMTVALPTASITGGNVQVCTGGPVTLNASSIFVATWQWYGSPDNVTFTAIPSATSTTYSPSTSAPGLEYYNAVATYSSGSGCTPATSNFDSVSVSPQPAASTPNTTSICPGGTNTLTLTVTGGVAPPTGYQWQYNNGISWSTIANNTPADMTYSISSSGQTSTLTFITTTAVGTGTFSYRGYSTNTGTGCTATTYSSTASLVIDVQPVAATITPNTPAGSVCAGETLSASFNGASGGTGTIVDVFEYSTDGGSNFNPYLQNQAINTSSLSGQTVIVRSSRTASGSGCNTSPYNTVTWTVIAQPVAASITPNIAAGNVCVGQTLSATFSGASGGSGTVTDVYEYSTDGGTIYNAYTGGQGISTTALAGQTVIIRSSRTASGAGCTTSAYNTLSWTVNANPVISANNTGPFCSYGVISISASPSGYADYQWSGPNGYGPTDGIDQSFAASGNGGTYTVTATDVIGCSSTASTLVVVDVLTAGADNTGAYCSYDNISLSATPSGMTGYNWTGPNGYTANGQDPATFAASGNAGTYTVTVSDGNGCSASASTVVTVYSATSATASNAGPYVVGQTISLSATSAGAVSYAWAGPNGYTGSGQSPTISGATTAMAGTYTVTATNSTGCTATASTNVVVTTTSSYTWTGTTSTDWTDPTNWVPSSPVGGPNACAIDVIIPSVTNNPVINSAISVGNLQMNSGAQLTLNGANISVCKNLTGGTTGHAAVIGDGIVVLTGSTLQTFTGYFSMQELMLSNSAGAGMLTNSAVDLYTSLDLQTGNFDATNGTLTFKSNTVDSVAILDNFSQNYTGTITGNITAERYYAASQTYSQHYMGSPINSPSLVTQWGASGTAGQVTDNNCDEYQLNSNSPYGTVFQMDQHLGAACSVVEWTVLTSGNAQNGIGYSILKNGTGKVVLNGPANLDANYQISNLKNDGWSNVTQQGRPNVAGWQLLSNPYLATLELSNVPTGFDNQVQVWITNGQYEGTFQPGNIGSDAVIAPFQGFMVHKTTPGGTATYTINATDRVRTPEQFYQQNANELKILATNIATGMLDQTTVAFNSAATDTFDAQYDAQKIAGSLGRHTIYTENNNMWMARNVLHSEATTSTVPMGFEPGKTGNYSFSFGGVNTFDPTSYIYLEDRTTGQWYNVRNGNYSFNADSTDAWSRFVLHFTPPASITTVDATCNTGGSISIQQPGTANWNYTLADSTSNVIAHGTLNQTQPVTLQAATGTYTLTLTDTNNYVAVKTIQVNGPVPVSAAFMVSADTVIPEQTVVVVANTQGAASYEWNFGNGVTGTGSQAMVSYTEPGVYVLSLLVTSDAGCSSTQTHSITVSNNTTGLNNVSGTGDISIWSNTNKVYVDFTELQQVDATVAIYNILGQEISNEHYTNNNIYQKEIDGIEAAYLVVMVRNADKITTRKVLITNSH